MMMNKYFINVYENENGFYDFFIELLNEEYMDEPARLGTRENIDNLGEVYSMIEEFPLSPTSELTSITLNRRNPDIKPDMLEILFTISVNSLIDSHKKNIKEFILN